MSNTDEITVHDLSESVAHELRDGFDAIAGDRDPWRLGKVRVAIPSLKDKRVDEWDGKAFGHGFVAVVEDAGGRKLPYDFLEGCIVGGLRFELLHVSGIYTGEAIAWDRLYRP